MYDMSVTELVSHLDKSGLNIDGSETFEMKGGKPVFPLPNNCDMSVTPEVHEVASAASSVGLAATNSSRPARLRLVYKTPSTSRASPTSASGQSTVTPLGAR